MHEHSSNPSYSIKPPPELPPCCGTGCAVCVLDMVEDCAPSKPIGWQEAQNALPVCCNTGCLVCVRDYPELAEATDTLAMLEAMEAAERSL